MFLRCFHFSFWVFTQEWNYCIIWCIFIFFIFRGTFILFSVMATLHRCTFPATVYEGSLFSTFTPVFVIFLMIAILTGVLTHCGFGLHFSAINDVEHLFMSLLAICVYLLWENIYSDLLPIFVFFFKYWCVIYSYNYHAAQNIDVCQLSQKLLHVPWLSHNPFPFFKWLLSSTLLLRYSCRNHSHLFMILSPRHVSLHPVV